MKELKDAEILRQSIDWWESETDKLMEEIDELESKIDAGDVSPSILSGLDGARAKLRLLIRRGENEWAEMTRLTKKGSL